MSKSKILRQWALPLVGAALFTFSMVHVVHAQKTRTHPPPIFSATSAAASGGGARVAGTGVIEPSSESIVAAPHRSGVVRDVFVRAGDSVKAGDKLYCLDDRAIKAELSVHEANLSLARAELDRLLRSPRAEELPPLLARVEAAKARLDDTQDDLSRTDRVIAASAISEEQGVRARARRDVAASELKAAESELALKRAGAWGADRLVAEASVGQASANVDRVKTELDLLCTRAPLDAAVLRVDVRAGELVPSTSLVTLGVVRPLHVRVDIDEVDIPRLRANPANAKATAFVRGSSPEGGAIPLTLVRIEPTVIPKRSLSGASAERVDTRVLQLIYRIEPPPSSNGADMTFVGEQVDVFLDLAP